MSDIMQVASVFTIGDFFLEKKYKSARSKAEAVFGKERVTDGNRIFAVDSSYFNGYLPYGSNGNTLNMTVTKLPEVKTPGIRWCSNKYTVTISGVLLDLGLDDVKYIKEWFSRLINSDNITIANAVLTAKTGDITTTLTFYTDRNDNYTKSVNVTVLGSSKL